jgi:hypothetical protein
VVRPLVPSLEVELVVLALWHERADDHEGRQDEHEDYRDLERG